MKIGRALHSTAGNMSAVYKIVFTGLLLFELIRYRWRKDAQSYPDHAGRNRH